MRKRRQLYAAPWVLLCTLPIMSSCASDGLSANAARVINEETKIVTIVFGRATDSGGVPLSNVQVKLLGDKYYETETDGDGYYRFEDVYIASGEVFIGSGASGNTGSNVNFSNATATYTLLFEDSGDRLSTFRRNINLLAQVYRTANSYVYEAVPYSFNATLVPFASFRVKVFSGEANADAEPLPAANALVEVRPVAGTDSANFETYAVQRSTNAGGVAQFDTRARLAAAAGYRVLVYPYDSNPDFPGYEYDMVVRNGVDLTPYSVFNNSANGGYQVHELVVILRDGGATTNAAPTVAFSEPAAGDAIAPQSPIVVYFTRSVDPDTIEYRLEGCNGLGGSCNNSANASDTYILTEELERTSMKLAFKPVDEITRIFSSFQLHVEGRTFDNVAMNAALNFSLDDQLVPDNPDVPMPHLLLASVDSSTSENYFAAVDAAAIYIFDSTGFDDTTYKGTMYSRAGSMTPDWSDTVDASGIEIYWYAVEGAAGYRVFGRDNNLVSSWIQLDEVGPSVRPPLDENYVSTTIGDTVIAYFDYYNDSAVTPFCCGNALQIAVLPFYAQSAATPEISAERTMATLNPNRILSLTDSYGPGVMSVGLSNNWGSKQTQFSNRNYDQTGRVAFSEYMDYMQMPVLDPDVSDADSAGIAKMSGRFGLAWTQWDATSSHTAWTFEMEPAIVTADMLYVGDRLVNLDGTGNCTITFINACEGAETTVVCGGVEMAGPTYALLGPVRDAPDPAGYDYTGSVNPGTGFLLAEEPEPGVFRNDTHETWSRWAFVDDSNTMLYFADPDRWQTTPETVAYMDNRIEANLDFTSSGGVFLSNQPVRFLRTASVPTDGELNLDSVQGANNRVVTLLDVNPEMVRVSGVTTSTQTANITASKFAHDPGTPVAFYPVAPLQVDAQSGDTFIIVDDPNNVAGVNGFFTAGMWIQIGDGAGAEIVEVTNVNTASADSATLNIDRDPTTGGADPIALPHNAGELVTLLPGTLQVYASAASVDSVNGMKPGITLTTTAGLNNNDEPYDTVSYAICAVGTHDDNASGATYFGVFAQTNNDWYRVSTGGDNILPFAESDLRPADTLMVRARDAAGNSMRPNGALLKGDGTVE